MSGNTLARRTFLTAFAAAGLAAAAGCDDTIVNGTSEEKARGRWEVMPELLAMVPIHAALLRTGDVLMWAPDLTRHSGHRPDSPFAFPNINEMGAVRVGLFDQWSGTAENIPMDNPRNLFCAGQCFLPDGRVFVAGGHAFAGLGRGADHDLHTFEPGTNAWSRKADMETARWYPTCVVLEDGKVLVVSGYSAGVPPNPTASFPLPPGNPIGPAINGAYDLYDPATEQLSADRSRPWLIGYLPPVGQQTLYPFVKLLPGGTIFAHNANITHLFERREDSAPPLGRTRSPFFYRGISKNYRTYPAQGACVLLPLDPSSANPKVLVIGGGDETRMGVAHDIPATDTAEIFEFDRDRQPDRPQDGWRSTASMSHRRFMSDAVLLPDGTVFVTGGSARGKADDNSEPVLEPELFDPKSETWTAMATQTVPRQYHSVAVLLPNGKVLAAGSSANWPHPPDGLGGDGRHPDTVPEYRAEIYYPPYLFRGKRPVITGAPVSASYHQAVDLIFASAGPAASTFSLLRPSAVTHTNDMEQRHLWLAVDRADGDTVSVRMPPDGTYAPPGWYMLFGLSAEGVPSLAHFIQLVLDQ